MHPAQFGWPPNASISANNRSRSNFATRAEGGERQTIGRGISDDELVGTCASQPFELMQAHDVIDRCTVATALVEHMLHRRETRWHCYQERLDYPERDDARWMVFVNSVRAPDGSFRMIERPVQRAAIEVHLPSLADGAVIRRRRRRPERRRPE